MNGLSNYIAGCSGFLSELIESATSEQIARLSVDISKMGRVGWINWTSECDGEVYSFAGASPSQRLSKKKWKDPDLRARLILAAYQHVYGARVLLRVLHETPLEPGGSYRNMATIAGESYKKIAFDDEVPEWPFSGKNPFE